MPVSRAILRQLLPLFCLSLAVLGFSACSTPKNLVYFQDISRDTTLRNTVTKNFDLQVKPGDLLHIGISSASPEQSALHNATQLAAGSSVPGSGTAGYLVDKEGNIQLYKLGDLNVAGLTKLQVKEKLQLALSPFLKDPVVSVRFLNQRVTVMGEVARPGVLPLASDQMTILEALGQSGDLTAFGRRDNIRVIRQTTAGKEFRTLNLLDKSIFTSPYFYLQDEDVVYVEPDVKRKTGQNAQTISYILSGVSILSILLTRFIQ